MPVFIDDLLSRVEKPARYTGGEMNATTKSFDDADVTFAFCFPDTYEVAMSHLGMKILYGILNDLPYALCERVCMPWTDMRRELKAAGRPLFSFLAAQSSAPTGRRPPHTAASPPRAAAPQCPTPSATAGSH